MIDTDAALEQVRARAQARAAAVRARLWKLYGEDAPSGAPSARS